MKQKTIIFLIIIFVAGSLFAQQRGFKPVKVAGTGTTTLYKQSHALVIGMSNYTNGWPSLNGVKKDIPEVKTALENNGFHVVVSMDKTRSELDKVFIDFITKYGQDKENRLLFYFAGHGHTLTNFGEINGYIVPTDAPNPNYNEPGFIAKAMPMSRIEEYAKQSKSKHALFLFDACFSGSLFATSRAVPEIISYKTAKPVRQFITSGSADETVPDKSIFRQEFVTALTSDYADANKDGYLTGTELGKFLQDNVVNYSQNTQHPQYGKIRNPYLDKGDFVFIINTKSQPDPVVVIDEEFEDEDLTPIITYGYVKISNYLQGKLYINNKYIKVANKNKLIKEKLTTGTHTIKIKTYNETWQQQVTIHENQTTTITAKSNYVPPKKEETTDLPNQFTDSRDGKTYKIEEIGNKVWMTENLAYKANSGCWAYDNDQSNVAKYGYLYNWETAKNVCPDGYRLPRYEEWNELETELMMKQTDVNNIGWGGIIGDQLKTKTDWIFNGNGINESGFNTFVGNLGGITFNFTGGIISWWSAAPNGSSNAFDNIITHGNDVVNSNNRLGFSVRCIKD